MDAGCELHGYCSDVTRTWPVNGTYDKYQRAIYEVVLDAHRYCTGVPEKLYLQVRSSERLASPAFRYLGAFAYTSASAQPHVAIIGSLSSMHVLSTPLTQQLS